MNLSRKHATLLHTVQYALKRLPGTYITSPLETSYWMNVNNPIGQNKLIYLFLELWFRTEDDRAHAISVIADDKILAHHVVAIHAEVGEPEDVLPRTLGFTAECLWFELNKGGELCIYGTPAALRDSRRRVLNLNTGAEPLMSFLSSARWQGMLYENGIAFRLSKKSAKKIIAGAQENSYGFPVPVEEMRNSMGIVTGPRSVLLNEAFQYMRDYAPADALLPSASSFVKHVMKYDESTFNREIINSRSHRAGKELHDNLVSWGLNDLAPRAEGCISGISAYGNKCNVPMGVVSLLFCTDLFYEILEKYKEDEDNARRVFKFIEGVPLLPDGNKPSMWDIYTSWKNGCEHWDLGPVLAAPIIEQSTASLLPHEGCRRSTPMQCHKILGDDKSSAEDVFALVQRNPSLAFLPTEEARIVAKEPPGSPTTRADFTTSTAVDKQTRALDLRTRESLCIVVDNNTRETPRPTKTKERMMPTYRELAESIYEDYKSLRSESKAVQDSNSPAWNPIDGGTRELRTPFGDFLVSWSSLCGGETYVARKNSNILSNKAKDRGVVIKDSGTEEESLKILTLLVRRAHQ